jgi:hypothetical protein
MAMTIIAAVPCHYGNYIRIEFETSSHAAMFEDYACTLRANSNALRSQTKFRALIIQY